jgi:uncharacterized membrane protein YdjX (TVP38/TMEM64 family)
MSEGLAHESMSDERQSVAQGTLRRFLPVALIIVVLGAGYALGLQDYLTLGFLADSRDQLRGLVADHPVTSALGFMATYAVLVAIAFPAASVLTVFGGFLFGWVLATGLVAIGATLGATALFLAARSAFGDSLRQRLAGRVASFADGFEDNAFTTLLVLRLAPVLPFFLVNVAPALFRVPVRTYMAATFIGILPGVIAYSWLGQGVDSVLQAAAEAGREPALSDLVTWQLTLAFVLIALVAVVAAVLKSRFASSRKGA